MVECAKADKRTALSFYNFISAESIKSAQAINLQGCQLLFWNFFLFGKEKSCVHNEKA